MAHENVLYYGDNLDVMKRHIQDESVEMLDIQKNFTDIKAKMVEDTGWVILPDPAGHQKEIRIMSSWV